MADQTYERLQGDLDRLSNRLAKRTAELDQVDREIKALRNPSGGRFASHRRAWLRRWRLLPIACVLVLIGGTASLAMRADSQPATKSVVRAALAPLPKHTFVEVAGGKTNTWSNYSNAGGPEGPIITTGEAVQIACRVKGFAVADGNVWWYRIASAPWNGAYFVSADAFYNNGETSGSLTSTPFVNLEVPVC